MSGQQQTLFESVPVERLQLQSKEDLIEFIKLQQKVNETILKDNKRLRLLNNELEQKTLYVEDHYITLKNKFFGKSSEKSPSKEDQRKARGPKKRRKKIQLPSLRYPNAPLIERDVELESLPSCKCCGKEMMDSGMTENNEYLTVIPAQHIVIRQKCHKYRCGKCHGSIVTAPAPPRIKPGSGYSDKMVIDIALSKYCDLIPIERYSSIAGRGGLEDLPPHSLIAQTHYLAEFVMGAYERVKAEILREKVLRADETPHRMLEDNAGKAWYLWGFSTLESCYFDIRNTRSGVVASELLIDSNCQYLVSDVFSGYRKAVKQTNKERAKNNGPPIVNIYCNAHARRKFKEAEAKFPLESKDFVDLYRKVYRLEKIAKARPPGRILRARKYMTKQFEKMKQLALNNIAGYSTKSSIGKAYGYFLKNYKGLTAFITHPDLPIDNNLQESLLRSPVVGRKTWYGTHSQRGAKTAAIIFTLVESCKLNQTNPRDYFKKLVQNIHQGKNSLTPKEFKNLTH